jgi:hypothetical protein
VVAAVGFMIVLAALNTWHTCPETLFWASLGAGVLGPGASLSTLLFARTLPGQRAWEFWVLCSVPAVLSAGILVMVVVGALSYHQ